jgi:hypothetical protein
MDQRKEQRVCIEFCATLGKSAMETLAMIRQGYRDQSLSRAQVFQWHARFKTSHTSVDDDERTGRPTSCTTPETEDTDISFINLMNGYLYCLING